MNYIINDFADTAVTWNRAGELYRSVAESSSFGSAATSAAAISLPEALPINIHDPLLSNLIAEIGRLRREVAVLSEHISTKPMSIAPQERIISDEDAKKEIKALFEGRHGDVLFPDEIADAMNIDVMQAIRICDALDREGQIGKAVCEGDAT